MMIEKELLKQTYGNGRLCPLVEKPYDECYFVKMKSQDIAMAMYYCYENFEICGIYRSGEYCTQLPAMTMKLKQITKKMVVGLIALIFFATLMTGNAYAGIYGQSVDFQDLIDQRTFSGENYNPGSSTDGLTGLWPGFSISWDISYDAGASLWNYEYKLLGDKDISHFILEVSNPSSADEILDARYRIGGEDSEDDSDDSHHSSSYNFHNSSEDSDDDSDSSGWRPVAIEGPREWLSSSEPEMPAPLYGIKFDVGGDYITYAFQTAKDPVWGNFYAKDGTTKVGGVRRDVYAYNDALGMSGFNSDNKLYFIPRPDGGSNPPMAPEPVSMTLFFSGGAALTVRNLIKKRKI